MSLTLRVRTKNPNDLDAHLLLEVGLGPAVVLQLKLRRSVGREIGIENTKGIEVGGVVASDLVSSDEELNLEPPGRKGRDGRGYRHIDLQAQHDASKLEREKNE